MTLEVGTPKPAKTSAQKFFGIISNIGAVSTITFGGLLLLYCANPVHFRPMPTNTPPDSLPEASIESEAADPDKVASETASEAASEAGSSEASSSETGSSEVVSSETPPINNKEPNGSHSSSNESVISVPISASIPASPEQPERPLPLPPPDLLQKLMVWIDPKDILNGLIGSAIAWVLGVIFSKLAAKKQV